LKYFSKENKIFLMGFNNGLNEKRKKQLEKYCHLFLVPEPSTYNKNLNSFSLLTTGKSNNFTYSQKIEKTIAKLISLDNFDIIQAESLGMVEYIFNLPESRIKTVFSNDDIVLRRFNREIKNAGLIRKIWLKMQLPKVEKLEKKSLEQFDLILTVTDEEKNYLKKLDFQANIDIYSYDINLDIYNLDKKQHEGFNLLFSANFNHKPNIDALKYLDKEIMPNIKNDKIKLLITGNCPIKTTSKNMECLGFVENYKEILSKTDLIISPLRLGGGIRIKNLEAMAYGLPVLTSNIGNEGINAENNNNILLANDKEGFIEQINWAFGNPEKLITIGDAGRKLIKDKFDSEKINKHLEETYSNLCDRS
ncbi:glycosyltransferase family 4 protein, partial [Patescibacteria group bacterium]|nr:glycosyltransferase family 4 protein [Patescibacteria group bacterium]